MKIKKTFLFLILSITAVSLNGCAALLLAPLAVSGAGVVKVMGSSAPEMVYSVQGKEIELTVSTYSANIMSIKNMTDVAAAIVGSKIGCNCLEITYAKWPNSMIQAAIKIDTIVTYKCTSKCGNIPGVAGAVGAIINVSKKLKYERELVSIIEEKNLLIAKDGSVINQVKASPYYSNDPPKNNDVQFVQQKLFDLGYNPGPVDGIMGAKTRKAIKKYQSEEGLEPNGQIDAQTLQYLRQN